MTLSWQQVLSYKYQCQYQYQLSKYQYNYQCLACKYKYKYQYSTIVLKYRSSTSTSTQYNKTASSVLRHGILLLTVFRFPRRHRDVIYAPPLVISSSCRLNSCGLRAFSVLSPRLWNSLPRLLRDTSHNTTMAIH